ncbi:MAG: hypothetical protein ACP5QM_08200, partial [Caldisericum sp.]|uniref:hypothetical protein n=1 Tax=Caldisericum sp. TaxID=2499687 RepID=UPI003D141A8A
MRRGVALITVILMSALVLTSIIAIMLKVTTEKALNNAQSTSQRSLTAAESCISQVAFDLRNSDLGNKVINPTNTYHYLTVDNVKSIVK